jgi:hypothetical protein
MKKAVLISIAVFLCLSAYTQSLNLAGTWNVEKQFQHQLGEIYFGDDPGLAPFVGQGAAQPIVSFLFNDSGMAILTLQDGSKVNAFYRPTKNGIYLQPQGGKDSDIYIQPISENQYLYVFDWTVPAESTVHLIAILARK